MCPHTHMRSAFDVSGVFPKLSRMIFSRSISDPAGQTTSRQAQQLAIAHSCMLYLLLDCEKESQYGARRWLAQAILLTAPISTHRSTTIYCMALLTNKAGRTDTDTVQARTTMERSSLQACINTVFQNYPIMQYRFTWSKRVLPAEVSAIQLHGSIKCLGTTQGFLLG